MTLLKKRPAKPDVSAALTRVDDVLNAMRVSLTQAREAAQLKIFDRAYEEGTRYSEPNPTTGETWFPHLVWPRQALDRARMQLQDALVNVESSVPAVVEACTELAEQMNGARRDAESRAMAAEVSTLRALADSAPRPCCGLPAGEQRCTVEQVVMQGESWRRFSYGEESRGGPTRGRPWTPPANCPGCGVGVGAFHHVGCTVEKCPAADHPFWNCNHERRPA